MTRDEIKKELSTAFLWEYDGETAYISENVDVVVIFIENLLLKQKLKALETKI